MASALHGALIGFEAGLERLGVPAAGVRSSFVRVGRAGAAVPQQGTLQLRVDRADKAVVIEVSQEDARADGGHLRTKATLQAHVDVVCSLRSWVLDTVAVDDRGRELHDTRLVEQAKVKGREIKWTGADLGAPLRVNRALTTDWTWMHAVERLALIEDVSVHHVDVIEHLSLLRQGVRVQPSGRSVVAGQRARVWRVMGPGLCPRHAFVHADGHLMAWVTPMVGWFRTGRSA